MIFVSFKELITFLISLYSKVFGGIIVKSFFDDWNFEYEVPENSYDFIVMTNFLDRNIIVKLSNALKNDGILFIETYMHDIINEKPSSNPDFLLKKDELKTFFDDAFEVLDYDEFLNEENELYRMKKQSIAIRKL